MPTLSKTDPGVILSGGSCPNICGRGLAEYFRQMTHFLVTERMTLYPPIIWYRLFRELASSVGPACNNRICSVNMITCQLVTESEGAWIHKTIEIVAVDLQLGATCYHQGMGFER